MHIFCDNPWKMNSFLIIHIQRLTFVLPACPFNAEANFYTERSNKKSPSYILIYRVSQIIYSYTGCPRSYTHTQGVPDHILIYRVSQIIYSYTGCPTSYTHIQGVPHHILIYKVSQIIYSYAGCPRSYTHRLKFIW